MFFHSCSEIAVDEFLRKRVDSLESSNQILQSDMDLFRQTTEKEIEMMKFRYDSELATTRKLIRSLEERVDANDIRVARSEQENEMWKDKIMDLVNEMQEVRKTNENLILWKPYILTLSLPAYHCRQWKSWRIYACLVATGLIQITNIATVGESISLNFLLLNKFLLFGNKFQRN